MSILGDAMGRGGRRASAPRGQPASALPASALAAPAATDGGASDLRSRRDALSEQVTELHWDLGGLVYEMAIRDHFRLDVLVRRAAVLQERDAELAEVERLLRLEEGAVAGACPSCGAPHSRGALYCWQCGATLMERLPSSAIPNDDGSTAVMHETTAVMDALLAPDGAGQASPRASSSDQ
jgi:hypothetical protein